MVMTEDEGGKIRATEEAALMALPVEEFFLKLLVFRERMERRVAEIRRRKKKHDD